MRAPALLWLTSALAAVACAHDYGTHFSSGARGAPILERGVGILVGVPLDGREGRLTYSDSGPITTDAILEALFPYTERATSAEAAEGLPAYEERARGLRLDYVLLPEILIWKDRNTQRWGFPDLLELRMTLVSAQSGEVIDTTVLSATSRTTLSLNTRPEDLLPGALARYATRVFEGR